MSKRKLRRELSEFSRKSETVATLYSGSLGIYIGGTQYVDVPNRPGFVYVRLRNNISELIQAHNEVVSPVYGLPVLLIRNKTYYEIYGRDSVQYGSYWDSNSSYLPKHGHQHEFDPDNNGGGDLVFVHGEQFYPMMTFPSGSNGSNTVLIAPYRYFFNGAWHYAGNTGAGNLLQYGPTGANNAKLLLVGTTSATGNPFVKLGSEFSEGITGAAALTQFVPTNITPIDEIPGAIIRLVTGTQTITWANIYDARQYMGILQAGSGTGGGATDFLSLTDTPNSYASQANKAVTVKADESGLEFTTAGSSHILNVVDDVGGLASGDNNDYAPTGYVATTDVIVVYGNTDNTSRITGITGGVNGRKLTIINGTDNRVTIGSSGGGSSAGNTIETNSSDGISIRTYEAVSLIWYTSLAEWVLVDDHKIRNTFWIDSSVTGTVTANQNNWSLTVFDEKAVFLMSPTADRDITGISSVSGTKHGQVLTFINISPTFTLTFKNESGSSAAANRFSMGADLAVGPGKSATFWYDKFAQRWRNTSSTVGGTGTGGTTLGLGFYGQDEAVGLGTGTTLNVVGSDISLSISGTVLTLLHSDPTGTPYSFLDLTDTPDSYSGQNSKFVAVNAGGTALEFVAAPAGGGGGSSGLVIYDDSVYKVTGTAISFDSNLSVAVTGSVAFVSASGGSGIPINGWIADANTWSYLSSGTNSSYVISVNANITGSIGVGNRLWLNHLSQNKYFIITGESITGSTTYFNVYGGTDYTLTTGSISNPYYSPVKSPTGFPTSTTKWIITISDTSQRSQSSPTAGTWYNLGGLSIAVPVGAWHIGFVTGFQIGRNSAGAIDASLTLSTANNSESDADFTTYFYFYGPTDVGSGSGPGLIFTTSKYKELIVASNSIYYLNAKTSQAVTVFQTRGDVAKTLITALCAYL